MFKLSLTLLSYICGLILIALSVYSHGLTCAVSFIGALSLFIASYYFVRFIKFKY